MFPEAVQQLGGKAEIPFHEIPGIIRTVHTRQIEDEIRLPAVLVQLALVAEVVFVDLLNLQGGPGPVPAIPDGIKIVAKGGSDHAPGTSRQYLHISFLQTTLLTTPT